MQCENCEKMGCPDCDGFIVTRDDVILCPECGAACKEDCDKMRAAAGLFRHEIKRRHRQAEEIIFTVTEPAYLVFARYARELARDYLDRMEQFYIHVKEQIQTSGVCGALDLLMAICNLAERYNRSLEITYYFDRAEPLYKVPRLLDCVPGERRDITSQLEGILQTFNRERYGKN